MSVATQKIQIKARQRSNQKSKRVQQHDHDPTLDSILLLQSKDPTDTLIKTNYNEVITIIISPCCHRRNGLRCLRWWYHLELDGRRMA